MSPRADAQLPGPVRWFPDSAIKEVVGSLQAEIAQIDRRFGHQDAPPEPSGGKGSEQTAVIAVCCAVGMFAFVAGMIWLRRTVNSDLPLTGAVIAEIVGIGIAIVLIGYLSFGRLFVVRGSRVKRRQKAVHELATRVGSLRRGHALPVSGDSVGRLPWLATELDRVVECDLYGEYRGHQLAVLRCAYVVDKGLTVLEDSAGKLASWMMSHVQHEGVRRQELEAIVFLEPLSVLPDVFWSAKKQPLNWYFKRAFQSYDLNQLHSDSHWLATSDVERCREAIGPQVQQQFAIRPDAMLQVLGGYVVLIPRSWDFHRPDSTQDADQIQGNLDWACELYELLEAGPMPDVAQPAGTGPVPKTKVEALRLQKSDAEPRRGLRTLAMLGGMLSLVVGGLVTAGVVVLAMMAKNAADWPSTEGHIVTSTVEVREGKTRSYVAQVEYEYIVDGRNHRGKRIAVGAKTSSPQLADIEGVLAKYPTNQPVTVRYRPRDHDFAVLEARLEKAEVFLVVGVLSALFAALGVYLIYWGARRPRTR